MQNFNLSDTIAAIATPVGEGGIGIVRLSGKDALIIADKVFKSKNGGKPSKYKAYTTHYGWIIDNSKFQVQSHKKKNELLPGEIIDEVILTVMRAPRSYTKEDVLEINCHGGIVALRKVLDLVLENGCRLAEPGEFTKRAFLNGRIDLTQAEAVLDIIRAKTDSALQAGQLQLRGNLSSKINGISRQLLDILAALEANIDFPEDNIDTDFTRLRLDVEKSAKELKELLDSARQGKILREGIHTVICGRPNVGKSSLLNALLRQERSIVTPIAGTTRDTVEEIIDIKGIPVRIVDTAGIIEPKDLVEKKAIARSRQQIKAADLVIVIFDGSKKLVPEDLALAGKLKKKIAIAVINKIDLKQRIEINKIPAGFQEVIRISAKQFKNIALLERAIVNLVYSGNIESPQSQVYISLRHAKAFSAAQKLIAQALNSLDNRLSLEFIAQDIKEALGHLEEVSGGKFSAGLLDKIFSEFCIGK